MNGASGIQSLFYTARWVLLTTLGLAVGLALGLGLAKPIQTIVGMMLVTPVILGISGTVLGASQWLVTPRNPRAGFWWTFGTAIGLAVGMSLGIVVIEFAGRVITGAPVRLVKLDLLGQIIGLGVSGTIAGLTVGIAQQLAMRRYKTLDLRWVLSCALGFGIGLPAGSVVANLLFGGLQNALGFGVFLAVTGLIVGALTAKSSLRTWQVGK